MRSEVKFTRLRGDERGSVAVIFALTVVVAFGAVGIAIDGARGYAAKSHLQNSVDAALLATAGAVSSDPSIDAQEYFTTFLNTSKPGDPSFTFSSVAVAVGESKVEATVDGGMPTRLMSVLGIDRMEIGARGAAEFGLGELELVLSLDTTGSMSGGKIDALKSAAIRLVDDLERYARSPETLRVGLVPFAEYVNVGLSNRSADWISVPREYSTTTNSCGDTYPNATYSCRNVNGTCSNDGVSYSCTYQQCDALSYGAPVFQCSNYTTEYRWNGCVGSRAYPLNLKDGDYSTRVPGLLGVSCPAALTPLTTSMSDIRSGINVLNPSGNTYIPAGVVWGWRLLSPKAPFDQSKSGGSAKVGRFLVLMTDGANTLSPSGESHTGGDVSLANRYTEEACTNVKADGISIFTVAFDVVDRPIKDILKRCASSEGNFFDASDSNQLAEAFQAIGKQLVNIRLAR